MPSQYIKWCPESKIQHSIEGLWLPPRKMHQAPLHYIPNVTFHILYLVVNQRFNTVNGTPVDPFRGCSYFYFAFDMADKSAL